MQTLECKCGAEILLIPDLEAMNHAIEDHVAEHKNKGTDSTKDVIAANKIREHLIAQVFEKASKQE